MCRELGRTLDAQPQTAFVLALELRDAIGIEQEHAIVAGQLRWIAPSPASTSSRC
jgi:hypothetical protein